MHYYVVIDLAGFRDLVDALGGVTIRITERVPIGQSGRVLTPGLRRLDGYETLWYARSRSDSSDYGRMSRQRCVLGAMLNEADPATVLRNFTDLAAASTSVVRTDIPQEQLPELIELAVLAKDLPYFVVAARAAAGDPGGPGFRGDRGERGTCAGGDDNRGATEHGRNRGRRADSRTSFEVKTPSQRTATNPNKRCRDRLINRLSTCLPSARTSKSLPRVWCSPSWSRLAHPTGRRFRWSCRSSTRNGTWSKP